MLKQRSAIIRSQLSNQILDAISTMPQQAADASRFERLALKLFAWQYQENPTYRRLCERQGKEPATVFGWRDIPAVTTSAFKYARLACFPARSDEVVFQTSGTTLQRPGRHYFRSLDFYRAAALRSFKAFCLPDREKIRMLIVGPSADPFPLSSLGFMFSLVQKEFGAAGSAVYFSTEGLLVEPLLRDLDAACAAGEAVFLLGTSLALLELVNVLKQRHRALRLPVGIRVLDTGGYKAQAVEISRAEVVAALNEYLSIPPDFMINEYGMTELSSQFYESPLAAAALFAGGPSIKVAPPWVRVVAVDPATLEPVPAGEIGMLRVLDLANVDSVVAIQTEDLGRAWLDRMELLRRASGAERRGCSLLTESILRIN